MSNIKEVLLEADVRNSLNLIWIYSNMLVMCLNDNDPLAQDTLLKQADAIAMEAVAIRGRLYRERFMKKARGN